ncbi:hypothetical protein ACSBR2_003108 [Camellia fascicularis]
MEKSKAEDSKPLATVEEIQRRLVRPPSLHSQSSTSSSTRPRNDDITSSESSSSTKRLEDYLDPILLSAIRAKIGGKRGLGGEMREKKEVEEFEWPVDELKVLMREAVELGDDDDGGVDVIGGVVGDDVDGVCWSPFQRFERTALKRFKGGVKDKQGMGEG